jgi:hypothetical protein
MSRVTSAPILPSMVAAAHLESCAAELARTKFGADDVAALVPVLARAQRQLAVALNKLSDHAVGGHSQTVQIWHTSFELTELGIVLSSAADAADSTAEALEEGLGLLDAEGDDTRS